MSPVQHLHEDLARLDRLGRLRALSSRRSIDFVSNDYLGLAESGRLRDVVSDALERGVPVGSGGSRLLRGNTEEHEQLERDAAQFFGTQSALYLGSGYAANVLLFSTLPQHDDLVVYDELIHASVYEGLATTRAHTASFAHNDVDGAADAIAVWRRQGGTGTVWIAVESLYSMDGDHAPLADFVTLANREAAMLLIDEAHAVGVYGANGRGLAAGYDGLENVISLKTCGKALGCEGALVMCPAIIREFLINRGRSLIFSTAPSPLMAATIRGALTVLRDEPDRRLRLHGLIAYAAGQFEQIGVAASNSPIQPVIIGDEGQTMQVAAALQELGFDIRGIRPPTVPAGTSRLRISLTLNVAEKDIAELANAMDRML